MRDADGRIVEVFLNDRNEPVIEVVLGQGKIVAEALEKLGFQSKSTFAYSPDATVPLDIRKVLNSDEHAELYFSPVREALVLPNEDPNKLQDQLDRLRILDTGEVAQIL